MKLIKCDYCNEVADAKRATSVQIRLPGIKWNEAKNKDLCDKCLHTVFEKSKVLIEE